MKLTKSSLSKQNSNMDNSTKAHIDAVIAKIAQFTSVLTEQAKFHDKSKLSSPEKELFDKYSPKLKEVEYGSDEYKKYLDKLKPALEHHYKNNPHHPEHYANGISGMDLASLVEMLCDWIASSKRNKNGDIFKSIEINQNRFGYSDDIKNILINTAKWLSLL